MDSYSELIGDLVVLAETRDTGRRIDAMNAEMDQAIQTGLPAIEVAKMEAARNRMAPARAWTGAGA